MLEDVLVVRQSARALTRVPLPRLKKDNHRPTVRLCLSPPIDASMHFHLFQGTAATAKECARESICNDDTFKHVCSVAAVHARQTAFQDDHSIIVICRAPDFNLTKVTYLIRRIGRIGQRPESSVCLVSFGEDKSSAQML
jgi:hypothetical protein